MNTIFRIVKDLWICINNKKNAAYGYAVKVCDATMPITVVQPGTK